MAKKRRARRKFTEADIKKILAGAAEADKLKDFLEEHRIYPNQFYQWKKKYGLPAKPAFKTRGKKRGRPAKKEQAAAPGKGTGRRTRRRFSSEQIKEILSEAAKADKLKDFLDRMKIHYNQYYRWKKQYAGEVPQRTSARRGRRPSVTRLSAPPVPEVKGTPEERVSQLATENRQLKDTIAELATELAQYKRYVNSLKK
jgi:transposase-like protein